MGEPGGGMARYGSATSCGHAFSRSCRSSHADHAGQDAVRWTTCVPERHPVRPADRDPLDRPAAAARVRLGDDLLAQAAGLDRGQRLGPAPRATAGPSCTLPTRSTGPGPPLTPRTSGPKGGYRDRTKPGRPGPTGQQAPSARRRSGHPARGHADRRQPQRRHAAHSAVGRGPVGARQARPSTSPASLRRG